MALRALANGKTLGRLYHQQIRGLQTFTLPDLAYDYGALEPAISTTRRTSLTTIKLSSSLMTPSPRVMPLPLSNCRAPLNSTAEVRFLIFILISIQFYCNHCIEELALYCHVNHSIFWKNLAPTREGGGEPQHGSLGWAIDQHYGSMEKLIAKMNAEGAAVQGSGWVWLAVDKELKRLVVETTANQDPLVTKGASLVPLVGIDVWEHAYYLQYKNVRPDYLKNIWKVINWKYAKPLRILAPTPQLSVLWFFKSLDMM
ncbi:hypothetical protein L1987_35327 [Smallanthus sonchifolius]|uniref:Uncharacterized protein n=1 Tax=Smallanthus sonchifolius TaxID=185202 RepID=A0ACB9HXQ4_9ASTR|nr:hypothetical protein L1987_35327 [Smallanthus sonchifolius]